MDALEYHASPPLRRPILVLALKQGWLDDGEAASRAGHFLRDAWSAQPLATIDGEEFYDFTVVRPQIRQVDQRRTIEWPSIDFWAGPITGTERDGIVLTGHEPSTHWRTFKNAVIQLVKDANVELVLSFGATSGRVPHTRPVSVRKLATDPEMAERYDLTLTRYQGVTNISGVLLAAVRDEGIPAIHMVASVPYYAASHPSPNGAKALVECMAEILDAELDTATLDREILEYQDRVQRAVDQDPEMVRFVHMLESEVDRQQQIQIPTPDELGKQFEDYLRSQNEDG